MVLLLAVFGYFFQNSMAETNFDLLLNGGLQTNAGFTNYIFPLRVDMFAPVDSEISRNKPGCWSVWCPNLVLPFILFDQSNDRCAFSD